jgi:hypothetical protein
MATQCNEKKKNVGGLDRCPIMPEYFRSFITTPESFKATPAQAVSKTFWQDAIKAGYAQRIYLFPDLYNNTPDPEETVYSTTPLGKRLVRKGQYEFLFNFSESLCFHKALATHKATGGRIILIDTADNLIGTQDSDGNFRGQKIGMFSPEKMLANTGEEVAMSPVRVRLKNQTEFDNNGIMVDASEFINELMPLTDAAITIEAAEATEITVSVNIDCDGTEILGLTEVDFLVTDAAGDPVDLTGFTDNGDGTYTLEAAAFEEDGTINLVAADEIILTDSAYEGEAVTITFGS